MQKIMLLKVLNSFTEELIYDKFITEKCLYGIKSKKQKVLRQKVRTVELSPAKSLTAKFTVAIIHLKLVSTFRF